MSKHPAFVRPRAAELRKRLREPRQFIQVVAGPRQVGKTTLVSQVLDEQGWAALKATADEPTLRGRGWIEQQSDAGRLLAKSARRSGGVLGSRRSTRHC